MKIEEIRNEDIGNIKVIEKREEVFCSFAEFVRQGYTDTTVMLRTLENPYNDFILKNDIRYVSLVGIWFLSVESYINTILKVLCIGKSENYENYKRLELGQKIRDIFSLAELDKSGFYKCGLYPQLQEFLEFRNSIFHDRYNNTNTKFKHTMFNGNPVKCNIIDVLQAIKISMGIFESFRYIFPGIDLMPNVVPIITDVKIDLTYYEKLDRIYKKIFKQYFETILSKHMLNTNFSFEYKYFRVPETKILVKEELQVVIKAIPALQDTRYNKAKTNYYDFYINDLIKEIHIPKDKFRVPNYHKK